MGRSFKHLDLAISTKNLKLLGLKQAVGGRHHIAKLQRHWALLSWFTRKIPEPKPWHDFVLTHIPVNWSGKNACKNTKTTPKEKPACTLVAPIRCQPNLSQLDGVACPVQQCLHASSWKTSMALEAQPMAHRVRRGSSRYYRSTCCSVERLVSSFAPDLLSPEPRGFGTALGLLQQGLPLPLLHLDNNLQGRYLHWTCWLSRKPACCVLLVQRDLK
jgi:hypothetical protein